jgi:hypothetical protein
MSYEDVTQILIDKAKAKSRSTPKFKGTPCFIDVYGESWAYEEGKFVKSYDSALSASLSGYKQIYLHGD